MTISLVKGGDSFDNSTFQIALNNQLSKYNTLIIHYGLDFIGKQNCKCDEC